MNPELATQRRSYVLRRMRELGFIDPTTAEAANKEPMAARAHAPLYEVEAPYVAEMARLELRQRFGPTAESTGYKVYTTIDGRLQNDANRAVRVGLIEYDRRHGWRGPYARIADMKDGNWEEELARIAQRRPLYGPPGWVLSVVTKVDATSVQIGGLPTIVAG